MFQTHAVKQTRALQFSPSQVDVVGRYAATIPTTKHRTERRSVSGLTVDFGFRYIERRKLSLVQTEQNGDYNRWGKCKADVHVGKMCYIWIQRTVLNS